MNYAFKLRYIYKPETRTLNERKKIMLNEKLCYKNSLVRVM